MSEALDTGAKVLSLSLFRLRRHDCSSSSSKCSSVDRAYRMSSSCDVALH
jgi:hypothetical protein